MVLTKKQTYIQSHKMNKIKVTNMSAHNFKSLIFDNGDKNMFCRKENITKGNAG